VIVAGAVTVQVTGRLEIHEKTMHGADGQAGKLGDLGGGEASVSFRKQVQQPQPALKRGDVVAAPSWTSHDSLSGPSSPRGCDPFVQE
jgi:hypothetical protein